jgi:hypothetical protein
MVYAPGAVFPVNPTGSISAEISRAYFVSATEVTQGEWKSLASGQNPAFFQTALSPTTSTDNANDYAPVEKVSFYSAAAYANAKSTREGLTPCYDFSGAGCDLENGWKLGNTTCRLTAYSALNCTGYRLPTEMEWRAAASVGNVGAVWGNGLPYTIPRNVTPTSFVNGLGLYHMAGNVAEYTEDTRLNDLAVSVSDYRGDSFGTAARIWGGDYSEVYGSFPYWNKTRTMERVVQTQKVGFRLVRSLVLPPDGVFCANGFHESPGSIGICERDEVACRTGTTANLGRKRWTNGAYRDCESLCAGNQAQLPAGPSVVPCQTVGTTSTTCTSAGGTGAVYPLTFADASYLTSETFSNVCTGWWLGVEAFGCKTYESQPIRAYTSYPTATRSGALTSSDPFGGYRAQTYSDRYSVYLEAGKRYELRMESSTVDGYLYLYGGASCGVLASDDDSGGNRNPLITFTATAPGTYYLVATSRAVGITGDYTIKVINR